jgi:hypothetical protein
MGKRMSSLRKTDTPIGIVGYSDNEKTPTSWYILKEAAGPALENQYTEIHVRTMTGSW